jgi:hypothetical protein
MVERILARNCVKCRAKLEIKVNADNTYTGGHYFGLMFKDTEYEVEYWECDACYKGYDIIIDDEDDGVNKDENIV